MDAVIHIGTPKSGTTTIQAFLNLNREALSAQGFRYEPYDNRNMAQMELGLAGLVLSGGTLEAANQLHAMGVRSRGDQETYVERFGAMLEEGVKQWPEHTYLASSEQVHAWLSNRKRIKALHGFLGRYFENVRYIVYYRPQEEFMLSTYSECIKRGEVLTFEEHFEDRLTRMNFYRRARMWSNIVGRENLSVRAVDPAVLLNGDLLDDFCSVVGLNRGPLEDPPYMNASLTAEEIAAYLKLGKRLPARLRSGKPNPVFYLLLRAYKTRLPKPGSRMELTDEQRSLIRAANARSNERLRAEFFPEQATLFDSGDG